MELNEALGGRMKYKATAKFLHDEDDAALAERIMRLFQNPLFSDTLLKPRSLKAAPDIDTVTDLLSPGPYFTAYFDWVATRRGARIKGRVSTVRNSAWSPSTFTSSLTFEFSATSRFRKGPFASIDEVRSACLGLANVGPSAIVTVETGDESPTSLDNKFQLFRSINSLRVPLSVEWVMVLGHSVARNLCFSALAASNVPGVAIGEEGDFVWLTLTDEPFTFAEPAFVATQRRVSEILGLGEAQQDAARTPVA